MRHEIWWQKGFTLIELMVVVVILGILLSIGYTSYQNHIYKSRRVAGQECLLARAQYLERYNATYLTYSSTANPPELNVPCTDASISQYYSVEGTAQARSYTLKAIPKGAQAGDSCGTLTLESNGSKKPEECW